MPETQLPAADREALMERLAAQGIYPCGSPQQVRLEADVARFLGREYRRLAESPKHDAPVVTDNGPILAEPEALMARHYDADLALFTGFLDRRYMSYSMGWYGDDPESIRASRASLVEAQRAKLTLIVHRARILGDERILDLGCGFGPLETYLAETHPRVRVTALTASRTQAGYIETVQRTPTHPLATSNTRLLVGDFGALAVGELGAGAYDRVMAIAVFEQAHNLPAAFTKVAALLRPGGRAFLHLIVSRMAVPRLFDADQSLTAQYFPGGRVWPFDTITHHTAPLELEDAWFINGLNYWRTLEEWHLGFWQCLPSLYPDTLDTEGIRHWNQYFSLCKACFTPTDGASVGVGHFLLRKPH